MRVAEYDVVWCVWCVVCGVWCVVCGVWCVVCGAWCKLLLPFIKHDFFEFILGRAVPAALITFIYLLQLGEGCSTQL
jgi:hypothetical protein